MLWIARASPATTAPAESKRERQGSGPAVPSCARIIFRFDEPLSNPVAGLRSLMHVEKSNRSAERGKKMIHVTPDRLRP